MGHDRPDPRNLDHLLTAESRRRGIPNLKSIYELMRQPGIISLAGGTPNAAIFPFDKVGALSLQPPFARGAAAPKRDTADALRFHVYETYPADDKDGGEGGDIELSTALQYGAAVGDDRLREFLKTHCRRVHDVAFAGWDLVLSVGNTFAWDAVLRTFCEPTDTLLFEEFTFPSALENAQARGCTCVGVRMDAHGIVPADLERAARQHRPKLLYTVPTGQNPTGSVLPAGRRAEVMRIAREYDFLVVEDEPYYYLQMPHDDHRASSSPSSSSSSSSSSMGGRGSGSGSAAAPTIARCALKPPFPMMAVPPQAVAEPHPSLSDSPRGVPEYASERAREQAREAFLGALVPSLLHFDTDGRVVRLDSFSKIMAPGVRMGWVIAQPRFTDALRKTMEASSAKPSGFAQALVYGVLRRWGQDGLVDWLRALRAEYVERRDLCCSELRRALRPRPAPQRVDLVVPQAGMFFWLAVPKGRIDASAADLEKAFFFAAAEQHGVLVVPGRWCRVEKNDLTPGASADPSGEGLCAGQQDRLYFRGTFSSESKEQLVAGAQRLAAALDAFLDDSLLSDCMREPFALLNAAGTETELID